ncbi:bifunctional 2',3'-cyclic-nucleotide 2'-phosphodiesterase/3'-nucleotidase [Paenibacillus sp. GSMTC-2017]|uniref:bifunctional 2',3'-cyclic-nucleotide 2'-phosphodiesterase/3'-nucleotidase n=1 Tax=Paenibacillus sp. GSMTC-2017 TaxID=2794350 RepID=UPI0018D6A013|nr:bifunctional 2',3'-cyclic-nucleotide 2'-phosphodiesterase/3'-nucleotidase [Paenibacillus sp. GSMTC-2017]MBH5320403.1 bifunctional 2',3'-cyclic-nucleotide 2'-phosphodiesterase/3'-nucleotidase [Paenibacillus sp. GSMTC-2017]
MKEIYRKKKRLQKIAVASMTVLLLSTPFNGMFTAAADAGSSVKLRIMETTDIHTNLVPYDYYKDAVSQTVGFARTSNLIKSARAESKNTFLVDNGDLIQGTPLGTYKAVVDPIKDKEVHPVYKAMNQLGYDAATLGNHEFNYGLDYLDNALKGSNFPYVTANVYIDDKDSNPDNDVNRFDPYKIISKKVVDEAGQEQTLKIGVIGFVPPQITQWDKAWLEGKVITKDIVATATKFVPKMEAEGADIIIAMAHTGFNGSTEANTNAEDAVLLLSKVPGIDAITFSHTHKVFPAADEKALDSLFKDATGKVYPSVDNAKGTINGVAAVQAGFGGSHLGIIDLSLEKQDGKWVVANSQSSTKAIYDSVAKKPLVEIDQAIVDAVKEDHEATIKYANNAIGTTTSPIHSYFALVQDDPSIQIVTNAQKWYVENYVQQNLPQYKDTPILSVGAPFKAGRNGVEEFTEIKAGPLAIKSAGDLYLYDNTLKAIMVKGSVVKEWLEMSAGKFNQIDPSKTDEQALLNPAFQVYNFDVIDGVNYQVDVTKPAKYKIDGSINDANSSRIINLNYKGKAIDPNQDFIIITNNYRASGGGNFPGVKGSKYIIDAPDENRQILMNYITAHKEINPSIDNNWSIAPITGDVNVTFISSPKGAEYAKTTNNIHYLDKVDEKGFGIFSLDLNKQFTDVPATHWANPAITELVAKQIATGKTETTFEPSKDITRAEFATLLVKALKLTAKNKSSFTDVPATAWYAEFVAAASENGLVNGVSKGKFAPNEKITREQMAVMASNALKLKAGKEITAAAGKTFLDDSHISTWAKAGVNLAVDRGVMNGRGADKFVPKDSSTRAEAAKVVYTLINGISVQLLGINDFHGQLDYKKEIKDASGKVVSSVGGAEYLAAYLKQREALNPNTLLVHAGDAVGASAPVSALLQDEPTIDFLNRVGFDIATVGNHEFDAGRAEALRLINGGKNPKSGKDFAGANFPYIAANVVDENGKTLLDAYKVIEIGGVKVGFIGVVTNSTPSVVKADSIKGLTFVEQAPAVNKAVKELKEQGISTIVILAHDPFEGKADAPTGEVIDLANNVDDEVDVIFAGHNHGGLNKMIDGKLVIEAFSYGTAFSDVDLVIDRATLQLTSVKGEIVDVKREGITPDAEIAGMIKSYQELNAPVMNAPVGKTSAAILRATNASGESALGNLIADGMREAMQSDFAYMNSGGIRNDLPEGNVTYGNAFSVQPFGNVLVKITLTGAQMKELMNQQWAGTSPKIGQISGFTYKYDDSKPAGQKIIEMKKADGTVLDDAASYTIAVNDYMASGGDGYSVLLKGTDRVAGPVDLDATIAYIKAKSADGSISAKIEGRFTKVN